MIINNFFEINYFVKTFINNYLFCKFIKYITTEQCIYSLR